jgi:Phage integrase, N-terminal SAM-like domain
MRRDTRTLAGALAEFVAGMYVGSVRPKGRRAYKPATVRSYSQQLRVYIEPSRLGAMKVGDVTRADVQAFADDLLADGLSPGTVSNVLSPIQAFYRRAEDREEIGYNPTQRIDLPGSASARPTRIASPAEASELIAVLLDGDRPLWATAFYAARVPAHIRLPADRRWCESEGDPDVHGAFENPDHVRHLWPPDGGQP